MAAQIIDGKAVAARVRAKVADEVKAFTDEHGRPPGLATILVGEDPASAVYVGGKQKASAEVGIQGFSHTLEGDVSEDDVAQLIAELNGDERVSGILCQLPVPDHMDGVRLTGLIDAKKDVDGLTTQSAGRLARGEPGLRPCTPSGVIELLESEGVKMRGARAVVVGRSALVGHPMAEMLTQKDATVTLAHKHTVDLAAVTREADILVVAAGVRGLIGAAHVKPGATVIDVGIHRTADGLQGDVRRAELDGVAARVTPVPGGVGPMTIAMLMVNTLQAARDRVLT